MRALRLAQFFYYFTFQFSFVEIVPSYEGIATRCFSGGVLSAATLVEIVPSYEGIATSGGVLSAATLNTWLKLSRVMRALRLIFIRLPCVNRAVR